MPVEETPPGPPPATPGSPPGSPGQAKPLTMIGGYALIEKIGQGGMGAVFKARQVSLDRIVALKVLPSSIAKDQMFIKRFVREARACAKLSHPNIVLGIDVGQDETTQLWYFAMEFVDGPPLGKVLKERKVLPEQEALALARDVAKALECAREHGFVHRDVKPDNILLTGTGEAKLADLGLARQTQDDASLTQAGSAVGTPFYMAPEQIRGEVDRLDIRTDLYALGGTLFHLVTGKLPFEGETSAVIMAQHLREPAPLAHHVNPAVSEPTSRLIQRLMQKEKEKRFQTPNELVEQIERILAGEAVVPARVRTTGPRDAVRGTGPRRATRDREPAPVEPVESRKPVGLYVGIGAAVTVVLGVLLFLAVGGKEPVPAERPATKTAGTGAVEPPRPPPITAASLENERRATLDALWSAAQEFEKANPGEFQAARAKYAELIAKAKGTSAESALVPKAEEARKAIQQRWQEAADAVWRELEQKAAPLLAAQDYDGALKIYAEVPPGVEELVRPKATEKTAAVRKEGEEKISPVLEAAAAAFKNAEPQKGLDALARIGEIRLAPFSDQAAELKRRMEQELADAAALEAKRLRLAVEAKLNTHLNRFDAALLEKGDLAVAKQAASAARDDAALKPQCEAQVAALSEIVKLFEDLQRQESAALGALVGTELSVGNEKGTVKKVEDGVITVTFALEGGKAMAEKPIRVSELSDEQRARLLRSVKLPETPAGKVAGALVKLRQGGTDLAAAEELLNAVPEYPLAPHYAELARVRRLGAAEVAAEKAWPALAQAAAGPCTEPEQAKALQAKLAAWRAAYGATRFSASKKAELDAWASKAVPAQPVTVHWIIADDADVYLNGKPLRPYVPDFRTRPDEAWKPFQADAELKRGDIITVGGRRGGSFGITLFALSKDNRVLFKTDTTHWKVYYPGEADLRKWYLPEVPLRSQTAPVTVQPTPFPPQTTLTLEHKVKVECIWDQPTARTAFLYAVVELPVAEGIQTAATPELPVPPAPVVPPAARLPVPAAAALTEAERRIKDSLKEEYQKKGATDRAALAGKLLMLAGRSRDDAPGCFVLLREAKDVAASVGDLNTAFAAVDALSGAFVVDAADLKVGAFAVVARGVATPEAAGKAADAGHDLLGQLAGDSQYEAALKLIPLLDDLARRANDAEAVRALQTRAQELRAQQAEWARAKPFFDKLKEDPENAEAALGAGKYYALAKGDWERALPWLAKCSVPALKEAATKDLANPGEAEARAAVGELWWAMAEREAGAFRTALQVRARFHYEGALSGLTGLTKVKVEKRLETLAALLPSTAINLMAAVNLNKDAVFGTWKADGRGFVSDTLACARIMLPYEVPEEYDYRVDLTRNSGSSTVALMLTKNGRTFAMETGWPGGQTGFCYVDYKHIDVNPTGVKFPITNGRRYSFLVQVRNTGLKLFVDGKLIIAWKTDYKNLTPHVGWALPDKQCVGFGSHLSPTTFHSAELIEVTGHGKRIR